jgi:hypothetical protein
MVKTMLAAVFAVASLAAHSTHAADDRALCGRKDLDLKCLPIGSGFTAVPVIGPETAYFATFRRPTTPVQEVVYSRGGWLQAWTTSAAPLQQVVWAGSTHTLQVNGAPGVVGVAGVINGGVQSAYMYLMRGDAYAFVANLDTVWLGPRTTIEVHFAKAPQTVIEIVDAGKYGDTLRLIVDKPFVTRRTGGGRTCLLWGQLDGVCLDGWPDKPFPVAVDASGVIASVLKAGKTADKARVMTPNLPAIIRQQAGLGFAPF